MPPTCTNIWPQLQLICTNVMLSKCCLAMVVTLKSQPMRIDKRIKSISDTNKELVSLNSYRFPFLCLCVCACACVGKIKYPLFDFVVIQETFDLTTFFFFAQYITHYKNVDVISLYKISITFCNIFNGNKQLKVIPSNPAMI